MIIATQRPAQLQATTAAVNVAHRQRRIPVYAVELRSKSIPFFHGAKQAVLPSLGFRRDKSVRGCQRELRAVSMAMTTATSAEVHFQLKVETRYGEEVRVVGQGHHSLGNWDTSKGLPLTWTDGHTWRGKLNLPAGATLEYKFILVDPSRARTGERVIWQPGDNRRLQVADRCVEDGGEWVLPPVPTPSAEPFPAASPRVATQLPAADSGVPTSPMPTSSSERSAPQPVVAAATAAAATAAAYRSVPPGEPHANGPAPAVKLSGAPAGHTGPVELASASMPDWFRRAVFYHVQSLGFFGVETAEIAGMAVNDGRGPVVDKLSQIRAWYPHLEALGVTAIYFGPLFESGTHGYDTADYFAIDRRLGDVPTFTSIVGELRARGIRVILDGVFNHTGTRFFAFQDVMRHGRQSRYADWFFLSDGTSRYGNFKYQTWEGHQHMPKLNVNNQEVREYIFQVARYWLSEVGVDGWRLDVASDIAPEFWAQFAPACKAVKSDCVLVGELIHGNYKLWVGSGRLDSCTNYQLSKAIWSSLNDANYFELAHSMQRDMDLYKGLVLFNFLGNHDVPRIASQLKNARHYVLATAVLMTVTGVPCIYYGDECGMQGAPGGPNGDLAMRRPLRFDHTPDNDAHFEATRELVALRKQLPALSTGALVLLGNTNQQFSYLRRSEDGKAAVVVLNLSTADVPMQVDLSRVGGISNGSAFVQEFAWPKPSGDREPCKAACTVQGGGLQLGTVPACSASIWVLAPSN
eukprot:jgi/Mesvir1/29671/Mv21510-RA.1